jgi:hypothetical protein
VHLCHPDNIEWVHIKSELDAALDADDLLALRRLGAARCSDGGAETNSKCFKEVGLSDSNSGPVMENDKMYIVSDIFQSFKVMPLPPSTDCALPLFARLSNLLLGEERGNGELGEGVMTLTGQYVLD